MRAAWCLSLLLGGSLPTAVVATQEDRSEEVWRALDAEVRERGAEAPAALLYNRALAALQAGHLPQAEISAEQAAARGDGPFLPRRTFVLGCADLARAERLAAKASQPGAPPALYDAAIGLAVEARTHWIEASLGEEEWPAAVRNAERAQLRIRQWEELRDEAARQQPPPPPDQDQPPEEPPDQPEPPPETPEALPAQEEPGPLTAEEIQRLREQLQQKEQEKLLRRRARRDASGAAVEKDW